MSKSCLDIGGNPPPTLHICSAIATKHLGCLAQCMAQEGFSTEKREKDNIA